MNGKQRKAPGAPHWQRVATFGTLAISVSMLPFSYALALDDYALPTGGNVVGGSATIDYVAPGQLDVHQSTDRAVIDWGSFNIGKNATTEFYQPNAGSLTVNRVTGPGQDPTQILGTMKSNGTVMVLDRNGVVFGRDSRVDVGGIIASTGEVSTQAIMSGNGPISITNANSGAIINHGSMSIGGIGLAAFVAPTVVNSGLIQAKMGRVSLASGNTATVDLYGDGLVELAVDKPLQNALVENTGTINAEGGTVLMTAAAAKEVVNTVINMSGVVNVSSATVKGGKIVLEGANTKVSGTLDASGKTGGGEILIGGDYQGGGNTRTATNTIITSDAVIKANTMGTDGDGGKVIVWADENASFEGTIEAKGGSQSGDGGLVETSGKVNLRVTGSVNASANNATGKNGEWLLDPQNVRITNSGNAVPIGGGVYDPTGAASPFIILDSSLSAALSAGNNVTITTYNPGQAQAGNIEINNATILKNNGGEATLTFKADGRVYTTGTSSITSTSDKLNTIFWMDADNNGVISNGSGIELVNTTITTNGGDFFAGGGADDGGSITDALGNVIYTGIAGDGRPDDFSFSNNSNGFNSSNFTLNTGDGNVTILGKGGTSTDWPIGVRLFNGTSITTRDGNILIVGEGGTTSAQTAAGVELLGTITSTGNGTITLSGKGGNSPSAGSSGISLYGAVSGHNGNITLIGHGGTGADAAGVDFHQNIFSDGTSLITLKGYGSGGGNGILAPNVATIGGNDATGNQVWSANRIWVNSTTTARTSGSITIKPLDPTNNIIVGGSGVGLSLFDVVLARFFAGTLIIGDSVNGTGDVIIDSWDLSGKTHHVEVYGNDITLRDTDATAGVDYGIRLGTGNLLLHARDNAAVDLGSISMTAAINKALANHSKIDLRADENIVLTAANMIASNGASFDIILNADRDADQNGAISLTNSTITTNGGYFVAGGGSGTVDSDNDGILGNGGTGADTVAAWGNAANTAGFFLRNSHISTNGGDVAIAGHGYNNPGADDLYGVDLNNSSTINALTGDIALKGWGGNGYAWNWGLAMQGAGTAIQTTSGKIDIQAYGDGNGNDNDGIFFYSGGLIATDSGDIDILSYATQNAAGWGRGIDFYGDGQIYSKTGKIDITMPNSYLYHDFAGGKIGGADSSSDITITQKEAPNFYHTQTSGTTTLRTYDPSHSISISGIESDLNLADSVLDTITTGTLIIGDKNNGTGDIKIDGWNLSGKTYDIEVYGNDINIFGIQLGTGDLLLHARDNGTLDLGRITLEVAINKALAGHSKVDLRADEHIVLSAATMIASNGGSFDVILNADRNANQDGAVFLTNSTITTNGGNIVVGGGSGAVGGTNGILGDGDGTGADDVMAWGSAGRRQGIAMDNSTLSAGAGNIHMSGKGFSTSNASLNGISIYNASKIITTSGSVRMTGTAGDGGTGSSAGLLLSNATVETQSGSIALKGTAGTTTAGVNNHGLYLNASTVRSTGTGSTPGDILIHGVGRTGFASGSYNFTGGALVQSVNANIKLLATALAGAGATLSSWMGFTIESTGSGNVMIEQNSTATSSITSATNGTMRVAANTGNVSIITDRLTIHDYVDVNQNAVFDSGDLAIADAIQSTSGNVYIKTTNANTNISLGASLGGLYLSDIALNSLNAGNKLIIGNENPINDVTIDSWDLSGKTHHVEIYGNDITIQDTGGAAGYGMRLGTGNVLMHARDSDNTNNPADVGDLIIAANAAIRKANTLSGTSILDLRADGSVKTSSDIIAQTGGNNPALHIRLNGNRDNGAVGHGGEVVVNNNAMIQSNGGHISLTGGSLDDGSNGGIAGDSIVDGMAVGITNYGVFVQGTLDAGAGGNIQIAGRGFDNAAANNMHGVLLNTNALLKTDAGKISVRGQGGAGLSENDGVLLNKANLESTTGSIDLRGTGGSGSGINYGVMLVTNSLVESKGTGANAATIYMEGQQGGTGTGSGVYIGTSIVSSVDGDITLKGTGGSGTTAHAAEGMRIAAGAIVRSTGATADAAKLFINAQGGGTAVNAAHYGLVMHQGAIESTAGAIDITATGGNGTANNYGLYMENGATTTRIESNGSADILIRATGGNNTKDNSINMTGSSFIGEGSMAGTASGDIHLITDGFEAVPTTGTISTAGDIFVTPKTASTNITLGSNGANTLALNDAELAMFSAGGKFMIGDSINGTGNVTVNSWDLNGKNHNVDIYGGNIVIGSGTGLQNNTNNNVTLTAQNLIDINGGIDLHGALSLSAGNTITIADADIAANGITADQTLTYDGTIGTSRTINAGTGTLMLFGAAAGDRNLTLVGDNMTLAGAITTGAGRTLTARAFTDSRDIVLGGGAGGLNLNDTELSYLQSGGLLTIGTQGTGTGALTVNSATFTRDVALYGGSTILNGLSSTGKILVASQSAGNDITLTHDVVSDATGDAIILASADDFFNNAASAGNALRATNVNGRWLVYSERMDQNTRGGLMPHASEFGVTYPAAAAGTGNRLIYSSSTRPELTLKVNDGSVVYGGAYVPGTASYTITGGLLAGDTAANIGLTGNLTYATSYIAGTTQPSGTPYAGMITGTGIGTLASALGYNFNTTIGAGALTVTGVVPPPAPTPPVVTDALWRLPPIVNYYSNMPKVSVTYTESLPSMTERLNFAHDTNMSILGIDIDTEIEPSSGGQSVEAEVQATLFAPDSATCLVVNGASGGCFIY